MVVFRRAVRAGGRCNWRRAARRQETVKVGGRDRQASGLRNERSAVRLGVALVGAVTPLLGAAGGAVLGCIRRAGQGCSDAVTRLQGPAGGSRCAVLCAVTSMCEKFWRPSSPCESLSCCVLLTIRSSGEGSPDARRPFNAALRPTSTCRAQSPFSCKPKPS